MFEQESPFSPERSPPDSPIWNFDKAEETEHKISAPGAKVVPVQTEKQNSTFMIM